LCTPPAKVGSLIYRTLFPLDPLVQVECPMNDFAVDTHLF
jgi:hypothetical protein